MANRVLYARKLYGQELGYRKGVPKQAGRYFFVSKDATNFFPPLSTLILNDHVIINVIPPFSDEIVLTNYVYHNSKIVEHISGGRNEFRLYLNSENDPGGDFFKSGDIVVLDKYRVNDEIAYKIHHFPVSIKGDNYTTIEKLLYASSINERHALILSSRLPFIELPEIIAPRRKRIPKEIVEEVLQEPLLPLPMEILVEEFKFTNLIRENSFRELLLFFYEERCAITRAAIKYRELINLQAAHIIPDHCGGPTHPKNGLILSRDLHWAFDNGFFTLDERYNIVVHDDVLNNDSMKNINGKRIFLPKDERAWPSEEALEWHRANVFGIFSKKIVITAIQGRTTDVSSEGLQEKRFRGTLNRFIR